MVTSQSPRPFRPSKLTVVLTGLGLLTIVVYRALILFGVGNVGEPTDIGGSALLLAGFMTLGIAVILGVIEFARRSRSDETVNGVRGAGSGVDGAGPLA